MNKINHCVVLFCFHLLCTFSGNQTLISFSQRNANMMMTMTIMLMVMVMAMVMMIMMIMTMTMTRR